MTERTRIWPLAARMDKMELREIRAKLHLTQEQLGQAIGRALETVSRYETGAAAIPREIAVMVRMMRDSANANIPADQLPDTEEE